MKFRRATRLPVPARDAWAWHGRPGALERLTPPWTAVRVLDRSGPPTAPGSRVVLSVPLFGPFRRRWVAEHHPLTDGLGFRDVQIEGPFARWEHVHRFYDEGPSSILEDAIDLVPPFGFLGRRLARTAIRRAVDRLFDDRHETTRRDLAAHARYPALGPTRIELVGTGALAEGILRPFLTAGGHRVVASASPDGPPDVLLFVLGTNGGDGDRDAGVLDALRRAAERVHGDTGARPLSITVSGPSVALDTIESAAASAARAGCRLVHLRLESLLDELVLRRPRRFPRRFRSPPAFPKRWVTGDDVAAAVLHAIATESLEGPVPLVAPSCPTGRRAPGPERLLASGFLFADTDLERALGRLGGRERAR